MLSLVKLTVLAFIFEIADVTKLVVAILFESSGNVGALSIIGVVVLLNKRIVSFKQSIPQVVAASCE